MAISYKNLFALMERRGITKTELQKKLRLSSATIAKLAKNEYISMKVVEQICDLLKCEVSEIISFNRGLSKHLILDMLLEEKKMQLKNGLYHQTQIKMAYNSNRIEGSQLTEDQTRYIYETNTIDAFNEAANVDDIVETTNHFTCFNFMLDSAVDVLSEKIIKKYHEILKSGTSDSRKDWFEVGDYKKKPNYVGDMKTTAPSQVQDELARLLYNYNSFENISIDEIVEFHWRLQRIHPFQDGNGRVGRMIMFKECLKNNIIPFIIEDDKKLYYYRGLKEFENEKGFLIDTCLAAQDIYKELVSYFQDTIV